MNKTGIYAPLAAVTVLTCYSVHAWCQAVYVDAVPEGMQSTRLVYAFKERLRRSSTLRVVDAEQDSALQVHLHAMDPDANGYQTVYSVAWTFSQPAYPVGFRFYNDSTVGFCGSNRIGECADSLAGKTDEFASQLREFMRQVFSKKK